jgi:hypothetical protein
MKTLYLNTILPELYFDTDKNNQFSLPFNLPGILFSIEKKVLRPVWVTTSLLKLTSKEVYLEKENILKTDFLIDNQIIPNFNHEDFQNHLKEVITHEIGIKGQFSEWENQDETIKNKFQPKFIPLFKKNKKLNYVLFYLEEIEKEQYFNFSKIEELSEEIEKSKTLNNYLLNLNKNPIIEINSDFQIEYYNHAFEKFFPKNKNINRINFLSLWSVRNQSKIIETIYKIKITEEEELVIFEETDDRLKKLKLRFKNIQIDESQNFLILISIENLNEENDKDKELTRKGFLLQSTQMLSFELEENSSDFFKKTSQYIIENFGFSGMYYVDLFQDSKEKTCTSFPKTQKELLNYGVFQAHKANFYPITRRNAKHVLTAKVFDNEIKYNNLIIKMSPYLLGIPLYEGKIQKGVMVYLCENKKIDIDSLYQLYSLTTIFYKIYQFQTKLDEVHVHAI